MKQPDIASKVMQEIESDKIAIRPRWHFLLVGLASILGILTLSGVAVYLINIITLTIRIQLINRPMFGARQRLGDLLAGFPWWMVVVAALAMGGLVWLLRHNSRLYRVRLGWIIALVLTASIVLGLLVSASPLNRFHSGPGQNAPHSGQWRQ